MKPCSQVTYKGVQKSEFLCQISYAYFLQTKTSKKIGKNKSKSNGAKKNQFMFLPVGFLVP